MKTYKKLWNFLTSKERRAAAQLFFLMLVGTLLEILGVGIIVPALTIMADGNLGSRFPVLSSIIASLGITSHQQLIIMGMLALVAVYVVKSVFLGFLAWWQSSFIYGLLISCSQKLFMGYLQQPYAFHLQRNSALLIRNATNQVNELVAVYHGSLVLLTELLVLLGILALLIAIEPVGTIFIISALGLAGWGFNHMTRNYILRWGEAKQHHEGMRIQYLQQGLGGAKDVKLLGREQDFFDQYRMHTAACANAAKNQSTLIALPRLWLELLAVTGLAVSVILMIARGKPFDLLLPTLGLFAAAAFRLMPSVNRILGSIQGLRYCLPVIDSLDSEYRLIESIPATPKKLLLPFKDVLTLEAINFQYENTETRVLFNISLSIPRGTSTGFIGGSGSGKSTLIDILLGLLTPGSGKVQVDGVDIQSNLRGWQDQIGYVPQSIFLTDDTLRRNIAFGLPNDQIDDAAVWKAVKAAHLERFVNDHPLGLETVVGERGIRLSGGQRQRIGIARALYHSPSVLVLDEATSSLDIATERAVMKAVLAMQGEKTIVVVAHRLSTLEHCDKIYRIEQGVIVESGAASKVLENAGKIKTR